MSNETSPEVFSMEGVDSCTVIDALKLNDSQKNWIISELDSLTNDFIGNTLSRIEIMGLPEKQEKAIKESIKTMAWKLCRDAVSAYPVQQGGLSTMSDNGDIRVGNKL